ncbi:MAG: UvrD-helicase domain-containing protein [Moraxella sp.]|nr:UvrD-helicase domain-containing protein [Moraxella sp.]
MTTQKDKKIIPAIECTLQGGYLIEASAGTGKTWTLTGILLRLLIEKKYPPERIIATTFTRNSAKEMQERLQSRLNEFYHYIHWIQSSKEQFPHWFLSGFGEYHIDDIIDEIEQKANDFGIIGFDDKINLHLIAYLLTDENTKALDFALLRISLLLATLDKLFIGTLDSLAQKWLKEFSSEMSYQADTAITMNDDEMVHSLIHDELRREHSFVATHNPRLYQMIDSSLFSQTILVFETVKVALQFYNAPIDSIDVIDDDYLTCLDGALDELMMADFDVFKPFYDLKYASDFGLKISVMTKNFGKLPNIIELIKEHKSNFVSFLDDDEKKFLENISNIDDGDKLFKKNHEKNKEKFYQLPTNHLKFLNYLYQKINQLNQDYQNYLHRKIAIAVKEKLKISLENKNQSTFTYQMVRLNEALSNNPSLARHIRYLYPVALIDESQDINGLQAEMINHVYLNPLKKEIQKNKKSQGFLLLVGDPKQAIYLFRGGDVSNYNMVKYTKTIKDNQEMMVLNQSLILNENHRSHQDLIETLNTWFCQNDDGHNHASFGDSISYQHITTKNKAQKLSWQSQNMNVLPDYLTHHAVNVLYFAQDEQSLDEYQGVAYHINSLLQNGHTITQDGTSRVILPSDIAILARRKKDLDNIKKHLNELGIHAISPKEVHVFTTQSAKDLYHLLSLMLDVVNHQKLGMILTSPLFGLSLDESISLLNHHADAYHELIAYFNHARMLFYHQGAIGAINHCLSKNPLKKFYPNSQKNTLWEQIAMQGERYMADLSQVIELIGVRQHSDNHHISQFMSWFLSMTQGKDKSEAYHQLPLPSETGVTLMTIHKSKGLEFPIVYIFGLGDANNDKTASRFYTYSDDDYVRRISPKPDKDNEPLFYQSQKEKEEINEAKRLGYVALTRASEQVFVIAKEIKPKTKMPSRPLYLWFDCADKDLSLPQRLSDDVGWIAMNDVKQLNKQYYQINDNAPQMLLYQEWQHVFKQNHFYAEHSTSATDIINKFDTTNVSNHDLEHDDILIKSTTVYDNNISYQDNDIRLSFIKGKEAGTFLHHILKDVETDHISDTINKTAKHFGFIYYVSPSLVDSDMAQIHQNNHDALREWVNDIISIPMLSSSVSLNDLPKKSHARELSFSLGISSLFTPNHINDLFHQYTDKKINIINDNPMGYYKYLNGEIDLIYEHQNKFYIVDYKSNFISHQLSDYHQDTLNHVMNEAGYWLQACIYQLALHRLLSIRIKDYQGNESNYLGEVEFIFLRGLDKKNPSLGHINWSIPIELVLSLDKLLGHYF